MLVGFFCWCFLVVFFLLFFSFSFSFPAVGIMYSGQPSAFLEAVFMNSVKDREAVTEKFHGFSSPFLQPVLNYGLSVQQGKVKFAECQHKQLCLAG